MGTNVPVRLIINITLTTLYKNKNLCVELLCLSEIPLVLNLTRPKCENCVARQGGKREKTNNPMKIITLILPFRSDSCCCLGLACARPTVATPFLSMTQQKCVLSHV